MFHIVLKMKTMFFYFKRIKKIIKIKLKQTYFIFNKNIFNHIVRCTDRETIIKYMESHTAQGLFVLTIIIYLSLIHI